MVSRSNNTCVDIIYVVLMIDDYTQDVKQMQWRGDGSVFDFVADVFSCQGVESMSCSSIGWNLMLRRRSKMIVRCAFVALRHLNASTSFTICVRACTSSRRKFSAVFNYSIVS